MTDDPFDNLHFDFEGRTLPRFVAVEGSIGVGKTTLAKRLAATFNYETLLESAEEKLGAECGDAGDREVFESLREFLPLGENATPYRTVAARLKIEEGTLRLQIHRMRKRSRKHIEGEIAQTVAEPAEQKAELEHLMTAMGR